MFVGMTLLAGLFTGCLAAPGSEAPEDVSQPTRSAAATRQAEMNLLQVAAFELERKLDENFSAHYVGVQVLSEPELKVLVYLTGADKADLEAFVEDERLFELIEVREEAVSRQSLRATREAFKAEMDEAGVTYTTGIKMEPARLQVYVFDIPEAQGRLKTAGVSIPEHVEFIEMDTLPEGG